MFSEVLFCIFVLIILYLATRFLIIQTNHVVVCATIGRKYTRTMKEGVNMRGILEYPLSYDWTYTDQQYKTHHITGNELRLTGQQIDLSPFECTTIDNVTVSVDTLLVYKVVLPKEAMYATLDPLNLLCQQVTKNARFQIKKYKKDDLSNYESDIGNAICATIAKEWTPLYGLSLESCEIQNISYDEDTLRRRRQFRDGLSLQERAHIEQAHALNGAKSLVAFR